LHVPNRLSNIDKHRRLPISVWWPALAYWHSDGPTQHRWEYLASWPLRDGDVVGRLTGPPDRPPVHHEFHLVAYDARPWGKASADLPRVAEDFHLVAVDARPWGEASADLPRVAEGYLQFVRIAIYQVLEAYFDRGAVVDSR
jgi:hypothetical protein